MVHPLLLSSELLFTVLPRLSSLLSPVVVGHSELPKNILVLDSLGQTLVLSVEGFQFEKESALNVLNFLDFLKHLDDLIPWHCILPDLLAI